MQGELLVNNFIQALLGQFGLFFRCRGFFSASPTCSSVMRLVPTNKYFIMSCRMQTRFSQGKRDRYCRICL
jgi:hypothetical protein